MGLDQDLSTFSDNACLAPDQLALIPSAIVDRVYHAAERLAIVWANADLDADFAQRMAFDALCLLVEYGTPTNGQQAMYWLHRTWRRSAPRDAKRHAQRPRELPLDPEMTETSLRLSAGLHDCVGEDLWGGDSGRHVAQVLQDYGFPRHRALAFVWRALGYDWSDVAELLSDHLPGTFTAGQVRAWGSRCFPEMARRLRSHYGSPEGLHWMC